MGERAWNRDAMLSRLFFFLCVCVYSTGSILLDGLSNGKYAMTAISDIYEDFMLYVPGVGAFRAA